MADDKSRTEAANDRDRAADLEDKSLDQASGGVTPINDRPKPAEPISERR
jgi:hypothetical protein